MKRMLALAAVTALAALAVATTAGGRFSTETTGSGVFTIITL